jgi:hypothetical protein
MPLFTSAADVGAQHYWFVPVRLFTKDQFRSDVRVSKVTAPVLVADGRIRVRIRPSRASSSLSA